MPFINGFNSLLFTCCLLGSWPGYASNDLCSQASALKINRIIVSGLNRTQEEVVRRETLFSAGDSICPDDLIIAKKRLLSLGIFSKVEIAPKKISDDYEINIEIEEKWTTIPVVKASSGGGVSQYTIGVYDPNVLGKYIEIGTQLQSTGGANSAVMWFKNPRLFDQRMGIDLQYWNTKRIRIKYDQEQEKATIKEAFLHSREMFYAGFFRELAFDLKAKLSMEHHKDSFSTDVLPQEALAVMSANPRLPPPSNLLLTKLGFDYGHVDGSAHSLEGNILSAALGYATPSSGDTESFFQTDLTFVHFKPVTTDLLFAQKFQLGSTSTKVLQYWYYVGGLDGIRGFADNRFAGKNSFLSNSELRLKLFEKPNYIPQATVFLDFLNIGEQAADLGRVKAASLGAGLRVILPKFYRSILRLDYAQPIKSSDGMNIGFGVQQFF